MVLLEILEGQSRGSCTSFLCELPVRSTVRSAVEHIAVLRSARAALSKSVEELGAAKEECGSKRCRSSEAVSEAQILLSDASVQRKIIMTRERLEGALATLQVGWHASWSNASSEAHLSFAGKRLDDDKLLSDYIGLNEKSKARLAYSDPRQSADGCDEVGTRSHSDPAAYAADSNIAADTSMAVPVKATVPSVAQENSPACDTSASTRLAAPVENGVRYAEGAP